MVVSGPTIKFKEDADADVGEIVPINTGGRPPLAPTRAIVEAVSAWGATNPSVVDTFDDNNTSSCSSVPIIIIIIVLAEGPIVLLVMVDTDISLRVVRVTVRVIVGRRAH